MIGGSLTRLIGVGCTLLLALTAGPAAAADTGGYSDLERSHWSFEPLSDPTVPEFESPKDTSWVRTPIDGFILSGLRDEGLPPAARADRRTLIRRVTFDLTGLPPTPDEIEDFLGEPRFDLAWERLVSRLLASPHYGVRWGQHWLDVVRFAESEGFEYDAHLPGAWMFRDYVVHAFNTDKPFDDFVREQLAGDEMVASTTVVLPVDQPLSDATYERRIAAGFHRLGPVRRNAGNAAVAFSRNEVLTERVDIIGTAFLGLTVGCARCHDHMFDPIRQTDYYRMQAYLADTYAHDVPLCDQQTFEDWRTETDALTERIEQLKDEATQAADEAEARLKEEIAALQEQLPEPLPTLFSVRNDPEKLTPIHLLERGDESRPAQPLGMRPPGVLVPDQTAELPADTPHPKSRLAEWIVAPENPLTARVIVNRIWQYHFGTGLVSTPNDFGMNGSLPSHPELLDHLAGEFIRSGWSIKALHRMILLSSCYQQASRSQHATEAEPIDPENRLLWRFPRRRLSAEELRDAMLAASGRLNTRMQGPSVIVPVDPDLVALLYKPDQWDVTPDAGEHDRRSMYLIAKRNLRLPFLEVFDQPSLQTSCATREETTHAPQALELLNGELANELADAFAMRLIAECGDDHERLAQRAFEYTTGRLPTASEQSLAIEFLADQPVREFALAMFNLNAFLYVD